MELTILSSGKVKFEIFPGAVLEGNLGELENIYPTIPAIEVTIPHVLASYYSTYFKSYSAVQIKSLRYLNKLFTAICE